MHQRPAAVLFTLPEGARWSGTLCDELAQVELWLTRRTKQELFEAWYVFAAEGAYVILVARAGWASSTARKPRTRMRRALVTRQD